MLLKCLSCEKKFDVPDSAITGLGRLVQCGSCGNKWTQFPVEKNKTEDLKKKVPIKTIKKNTIKKKRKINLYTDEYLKKKHGLLINDSSKETPNKNKIKKQIKSGFGFYSYLITIIVFLFTIFGFLSLTKDIIILNFPFTESYINYFYEILGIIKTIIFELIN
tara:strand:+ start:85 stop:573 length:489 start_codon:yes stop_codon:yes gene_type:complete